MHRLKRSGPRIDPRGTLIVGHGVSNIIDPYTPILHLQDRI